jgi:glucosylglycerate phosphorylase
MKKYTKILDSFQEIYGEECGAKFIPELIDALEDFHLPEQRQARIDLSEKDAILITYGDGIRSGNQIPLQALNQFLLENVQNVIPAVHLLPFFPYSSDDGFSVIDFKQVDPDLGTWADIDSLAENYDLMYDAVINHISVKSEWFRKFLAGDTDYTDYFITVDDERDFQNVFRPRALPLLTEFKMDQGLKKVWTTFSADQVDLNYHNPQVLIDIVRILLDFVAHGARFIRLDAIAFIWKEPGTSCIHLENAHRIVKFLRSIFDCLAPFVKIITETNVPHEENVAYFGDGSNEAQLVYNFSLPPLVLDAFHKQSTQTLSCWAKTLETPSEETHFFNFLASHDGIGVTPAKGLISDEAILQMCERVKALGGFVSYKDNPDGTRSPYELNINYLDALGNPSIDNEPEALIADRFLASQSIMLALKGVPGIYYHSLLGSRSWKAGVGLTGRNRTINRKKLDLERLLSELQAPHSLRRQVFYGYLEMLQTRSFYAGSAFSPQGNQAILEVDERLMVILRLSPDRRYSALCFTNVTQDLVSVDLACQLLSPLLAAVGQNWHSILSRNSRSLDENEANRFEIGPYGVLWLLSDKN